MVQYNSFGICGWLDALTPDVLGSVEVVLGDVRDPGSVLDLLQDAEVVYHLAALIAIPYSYRAPRSYLDTNAGGTLNVLEAARALRHAARRAHVDQRGVRHGPQRADRRGATRCRASPRTRRRRSPPTSWPRAITSASRLPVVTLRPFNTFGPRQSARAVIPTIMSAARRGPDGGPARPARRRRVTSPSWRTPRPPSSAVGAAPAGGGRRPGLQRRHGSRDRHRRPRHDHRPDHGPARASGAATTSACGQRDPR